MKLDLDEFTFHRTLNEEDDVYRTAIYYLLSKKTEHIKTSNSPLMIELWYGEACTECIGSSFELLLINTSI